VPLTFPLGGGREFDRIREIARVLGAGAAQLGDDCALVHADGATLALSTDVSVENVHFRTEWLSCTEIGWRAAAGALSDLAAEGAEPIGLLAAVTVPPAARDADVTAIMEGVGGAVTAVGGTVLGGDLSAGGAWSVAVTVIGRASIPVTRAGAQPGDSLWVTGVLGAARAALEAWRRGDVPTAAARAAFAQPTPRIAAGTWLARHGARAMLDLSDGLAGDAAHLAAASRVGLAIALDSLPITADAIAAAGTAGIAPGRFAAEGGEDYELLVALPPAFGQPEADRFRRECGVALTGIGTVEAGQGVRFELGGRALALEGFDHFR
jgi:thiamine-monophosphate kinase